MAQALKTQEQFKAIAQVEMQVRLLLNGKVTQKEITICAWKVGPDSSNDWAWDTEEGGSVEQYLEDLDLSKLLPVIAGKNSQMFNIVVIL